MLVFQMRNPDRESTRLDIFVNEPFVFTEEFAQAKWEEVAGIRAPILRYSELIRLKRSSGRPEDLIDIEQLELMFGKKEP